MGSSNCRLYFKTKVRYSVMRMLVLMALVGACVTLIVHALDHIERRRHDSDSHHKTENTREIVSQAEVPEVPPDIRLPLAKYAIQKNKDKDDYLPRVVIRPERNENVSYVLSNGRQPLAPYADTERGGVIHKRHPPVERSALKGYGRLRGACESYTASARMVRSVYVNVLGKGVLISYNDVTLVTQLTAERIEKLYSLTRRWSGPISASVYVTHSIYTFLTTLKKRLETRRNIAIHIVGKHGVHFPVNFLRNVALRNAQTKYVFLTDVDFQPMPKLDIRLQEYIEMGYLTGNQILVVPAFEALIEPVMFPQNKKQLLQMWKASRTVKPFHFNSEHGKETSTPTESQTDYPKWEKTSVPYLVNWALYYEPYVVMEKSKTPEYWPEFVGRFYNKFSHLAELFAMGYEFLVLPDVFTLHTPHLPQPGTDLEQKCGKRVYTAFKIHLMMKYGVELP